MKRLSPDDRFIVFTKKIEEMSEEIKSEYRIVSKRGVPYLLRECQFKVESKIEIHEDGVVKVISNSDSSILFVAGILEIESITKVL